MDSHEIVREAVRGAGAKKVAADMGLSPSLVYKWCEPRSDGDSGAANPLDRVADLYRLTGDQRIVDWICRQANCFPVQNPKPPHPDLPQSLIKSTQVILREFSDLLEDVSESIEDDGSVDRKEAREIRLHWERLKQLAESFIVACEAGRYNTKGQKD
jgi:hypothetical protein